MQFKFKENHYQQSIIIENAPDFHMQKKGGVHMGVKHKKKKKVNSDCYGGSGSFNYKADALAPRWLYITFIKFPSCSKTNKCKNFHYCKLK